MLEDAMKSMPRCSLVGFRKGRYLLCSDRAATDPHHHSLYLTHPKVTGQSKVPRERPLESVFRGKLYDQVIIVRNCEENIDSGMI